jgi:ABC-type protease/lipase transport system fused ATPase/permease subunit
MAIATVVALGMVSSIVEFWGGRFSDSLRASDKVARSNAFYGGLSRMIRMVLQLAVLGAGAYLVLPEEMTAGMIFAASIISGRALQPLDQIVGSWRQVIEASQAWSAFRRWRSWIPSRSPPAWNCLRLKARLPSSRSSTSCLAPIPARRP